MPIFAPSGELKAERAMGIKGEVEKRTEKLLFFFFFSGVAGKVRARGS